MLISLRSTTPNWMASSSSSSIISFRERVFVRHATLLTKRKKQAVDRYVVDTAIIEANDGDEKSATTEKDYAARNTVKHCFYRPSNPYFFIPHWFSKKVIPGAVSAEKLSNLITFLD